MTWIALTLLAAFSQAWRNALQSQLSGHVSVAGVTLARFLPAAPIALCYLWAMHWLEHSPMTLPELATLKYIGAAAVLQIVATGLMVILFKQNNYAVGAGLAKSEAVVAAVLGTLFFGSALSMLGWVGVVIGGIAVLLLSGFSVRQLSLKTAVLGFLCGTSFALTSLYVREASLASGLEFPLGAAWVLMSVIACQCIILAVYLSIWEPNTWRAMWMSRRTVITVGVCSCIGSIGWFSAMSLQHVAYVKTLGQLEIFFMIAISRWWLKKPVAKKDFWGLCLIALAAILVMMT